MKRAAAFGGAALILLLGACDRPPPPPAADSGAATTPPPTIAPTTAPTPAPSPSASESATGPLAPAELVPEAEKGEKGARNVLLAWARALELGRYDDAFDRWGAAAETRSGMTRAEHAAYWRKFKTVTIAMPTGTMEGAAGSSYYTAPTTVVGKQRANGKPYRLEGEVVLRRVNDVPGASADQLRWHIERVDLHDAT